MAATAAPYSHKIITKNPSQNNNFNHHKIPPTSYSCTLNSIRHYKKTPVCSMPKLVLNTLRWRKHHCPATGNQHGEVGFDKKDEKIGRAKTGTQPPILERVSSVISDFFGSTSEYNLNDDQKDQKGTPVMFKQGSISSLRAKGSSSLSKLFPEKTSLNRFFKIKISGSKASFRSGGDNGGGEGRRRRGKKKGEREGKKRYELCKKKIMMGEKCRPLNGRVLEYDQNGILVPDVSSS